MLLTKLGTGKVSVSMHCRLQVAVKTALDSYGPHYEKQHGLESSLPWWRRWTRGRIRRWWTAGSM